MARRADLPVIRWLAKRLRYAADRLDPDGAPRSTGITFRFQRTGRGGMVFQRHGRGCPLYILQDYPAELWYLNKTDYERAHNE